MIWKTAKRARNQRVAQRTSQQTRHSLLLHHSHSNRNHNHSQRSQRSTLISITTKWSQSTRQTTFRARHLPSQATADWLLQLTRTSSASGLWTRLKPIQVRKSHFHFLPSTRLTHFQRNARTSSSFRAQHFSLQRKRNQADSKAIFVSGTLFFQTAQLSLHHSSSKSSTDASFLSPIRPHFRRFSLELREDSLWWSTQRSSALLTQSHASPKRPMREFNQSQSTLNNSSS